MSESVGKLNSDLLPLFEGRDDNYAVVKTLTSSDALVFENVLESDEVVVFWAEEDFSYTCSASPEAASSTSHRWPAYVPKELILKAGTNMSVVGTDNSYKFYLSR